MNKTQLWGEAVVEHPSGIDASACTLHQNDFYSSLVCLLFVVFLLLTYKYIRRSLLPILRCCFSFSQTIKTEDNLSIEQGRIGLFLFSLFHFSVVAYFFAQIYGVNTRGLPLIPLFFLIYTLIYVSRWAVFVFTGWVIRHPNELKFIARGSRDYLILATILTLPLPLFSLFSWSSLFLPLAIWCVSALVICYFLFLYRTLRYFLYVRFSIFFWILYLCSLEIAPLALLYSVLLPI
jgi:hypothetical protein